jgi:site-specific DNA-methyltransferase (adenine-specific)
VPRQLNRGFGNKTLIHFLLRTDTKNTAIYFYSKTKFFKFNTIYTPYSETTNIDQILQRRTRDEHNKSVYDVDDKGEFKHGDRKKGVPLSDVWEMPYLNPKAKE